MQLHLSEFTQGLDLGLTDWGSAQGNPAELAARLADLAARDYRLDRLRRAVTARSSACGSSWARRSSVEAVEAPLANGFVSAAGKVAVATEEDFFGSRRHTRTAPRFTRRRTDSIADELEPGDFAVHRIHGVGRYAGITHRALAGAERDYLILEYAQGDKLFVPSDQVGMVARYLGGDAPRLHRLGGSDWVTRHHQGQARRAGHGRRARPPLQRPHVGRRATRSAPTRRGSTSWRTRSRTTRPATSSPRSRRSSTTWSCPSRWTA